MDDIVVKNLKKSFRYGKRAVKAVDNLSFSVKKGEFFGLLGVNGAGKTTTINMLTGLLKQDSGTVRIMGKDPEVDWEFVKNKVNVSTAYFDLADVLTIRQNLLIFAKIYGIKHHQRKIDDLLEKFELKHIQHRKFHALSSGEKTRTALAKGLINDPKVLFLDECTVGLDPDMAQKTRQLLKDYQKKSGCTILFTSHYMAEVEELCDRIAFMKKGRIVAVETPENLKALVKEYLIKITVQSPSKLKAFLKIKNIMSKGKTVYIPLHGEKKKVYKILNRIFAAGFRVDDLHIHRPTLDNIFIKIAREK